MKGEDPSHPLLRILSLLAEYLPSTDRRPRTQTAYHSHTEEITCIFQTARQPSERVLAKFLLKLSFANIVTQALKTREHFI